MSWRLGQDKRRDKKENEWLQSDSLIEANIVRSTKTSAWADKRTHSSRLSHRFPLINSANLEIESVSCLLYYSPSSLWSVCDSEGLVETTEKIGLPYWRHRLRIEYLFCPIGNSRSNLVIDMVSLILKFVFLNKSYQTTSGNEAAFFLFTTSDFLESKVNEDYIFHLLNWLILDFLSCVKIIKSFLGCIKIYINGLVILWWAVPLWKSSCHNSVTLKRELLLQTIPQNG